MSQVFSRIHPPAGSHAAKHSGRQRILQPRYEEVPLQFRRVGLKGTVNMDPATLRKIVFPGQLRPILLSLVRCAITPVVGLVKGVAPCLVSLLTWRSKIKCVFSHWMQTYIQCRRKAQFHRWQYIVGILGYSSQNHSPSCRNNHQEWPVQLYWILSHRQLFDSLGMQWKGSSQPRPCQESFLHIHWCMGSGDTSGDTSGPTAQCAVWAVR